MSFDLSARCMKSLEKLMLAHQNTTKVHPFVKSMSSHHQHDPEDMTPWIFNVHNATRTTSTTRCSQQE
jgi:hypothetical protein